MRVEHSAKLKKRKGDVGQMFYTVINGTE